MKLSQTRYKPLSKEGKNRMKRVYPRDKQSRGNSGACCSSHLFSSLCSIIHSLLRFVLCCAFFFYPVYPYSCFFLRLTYFFACMVYASSHRNICVTSVYTSRDSFFGLPSSHLLLFCFIVVRNTLRAYVVLDV